MTDTRIVNASAAIHRFDRQCARPCASSVMVWSVVSGLESVISCVFTSHRSSRKLITDNCLSQRTRCSVRFQRVSVKKCNATCPIHATVLPTPVSSNWCSGVRNDQ